MNHIALYRKYRPKTFDEIFGQSAIVQTLKNQIISDRICHAYLFSGLRGSGKTSIARIFAKAVNCEHPVDGNPCYQCSHCNYQNDVNPDIIEIDAASNNGVDSIRQLIDEVNYKPTNTKYKIYIIDEVHMLSGSAFNALLKTIEEPPKHAIFILATTELYKVPLTIRSRCQLFIFKSIATDIIKSNLINISKSENINYFDEQSFEFMAEKADGSMRDAVNILDQAISSYQMNTNTVTESISPFEQLLNLFGEIDDKMIISFAEAIEQSDAKKCIDLLHKQYSDGKDLKCILDRLYQYYFDKYTSDFGTENGTIFERYARILGETIVSIERSSNKMTLTEIALIKMCKPEMETDYNSVVQRMRNLERELQMLKSGNLMIQQEEKQEVFDENDIIYYNNICSHTIVIT